MTSALKSAFEQTVRIGVLSSALLAVAAPAAMALDVISATPVQYRDQQYRDDRYREDQYRQDQDRRPDEDRRRNDEQQRDRYRGQDRGQDRGGRGGSYQQSCSEIRQDGSTLTAVCDNGRGRHVESSIDINRCGRADIGNQAGVLACGGVRGNGRRVD